MFLTKLKRDQSPIEFEEWQILQLKSEKALELVVGGREALGPKVISGRPKGLSANCKGLKSLRSNPWKASRPQISVQEDHEICLKANNKSTELVLV